MDRRTKISRMSSWKTWQPYLILNMLIKSDF